MLTRKLRFDGELFQDIVFTHQMRLTESHRCHHRSTIVIQHRIQRIHSILAAKIVCLLFSISVYFLLERILRIDRYIKRDDDTSFHSTPLVHVITFAALSECRATMEAAIES